MKKLRDADSKPIVTAALITVLLAAIAAATPLEDQICVEYCPYPKYPWIPFWRVAVVMFFSWLVAASFVSRERTLLTWFTLTSAAAMVVAHYLHLALIASVKGVEISLLPFFYTIRSSGGTTLYLDLAQIVIVATAVELYFISRRAPRTALGVGKTP